MTTGLCSPREALAERSPHWPDIPPPDAVKLQAEIVWFGVPCAVLVVQGLGSQAAVEDADEPVREGAQSLVVGGSTGALPVVERAGAR
jgi:hypothetical protein